MVEEKKEENKSIEEPEEPSFADINGYIYILENLKQRFKVTDLERDALNFAIFLVTEFVISEGERPTEIEEEEQSTKVPKPSGIKPVAGQLDGYV